MRQSADRGGKPARTPTVRGLEADRLGSALDEAPPPARETPSGDADGPTEPVNRPERGPGVRRERRAQRRKKRLAEPADRSLKETLESVVLAFILAFTFRAYVIEAYIIPTGSMAPTLLGGHVEAVCEACGYPIVADAAPLRDHPQETIRCPMCFLETPLEAAPGLPPAVHAGDRILVQKYLGGLADPKRFDVVVFKNPQNPFGPGQNFIKRLCGLPGERLMLLDGNVHVAQDQPGLPDERLRWRIARKTDADANPRAEAVQRAVFQPVWHSRYTPTGDADQRWAHPWNAGVGRWLLDANAFTPVADDAAGSGGPWAMFFDFTPVAGRPGYLRPAATYPYNQLGYGPGDLDVFEDFRLAATLEPDPEVAFPGSVEATLGGTTRLTGGPVGVRARFTRDAVLLETRPTAGDEPWERLAASAEGIGLPDAEDRPRLELWVVDQELSAWVNGERVARHRVDLSFAELMNRPPPPRPAEQALVVSLAGLGAPGVRLVDLDLDRDLYHHAGGLGRFRGGVSRNLDGRIPRHLVEPVRLAEDQFFLVGDNSPQSDDSRRWSAVDPWIRGRYFAGRSTKDATGRVPRGLLVGRAFFVYYPAARPLRPGGAAIVPDAGRMRWIH